MTLAASHRGDGIATGAEPQHHSDAGGEQRQDRDGDDNRCGDLLHGGASAPKPLDQRDRGDDRHADRDHPAASLKPHHRLPPINQVACIAGLAPATIGWLQVPLTASRAARLAAFTARTNIDPVSVVLDLLDDKIFNMSLACVVPAAKASVRADNLSAEHPNVRTDRPQTRTFHPSGQCHE